MNFNKFITIPFQSTLSPKSHQRDQILWNSLRIGHTHLTHSYVIDYTYPQNTLTVIIYFLLSTY